MNIQKVQQQDQAFYTKLTAVTIGHGRYKSQFFAMLPHNNKGEAVLPQALLDKHLDRLRVQRGQTYTVG